MATVTTYSYAELDPAEQEQAEAKERTIAANKLVKLLVNPIADPGPQLQPIVEAFDSYVQAQLATKSYVKRAELPEAQVID